MLTRWLQELLLAVASLPLLVQPTFAHVIWFPPDQGGYKLRLSEFDETTSESYDPAGLLNITAYDNARHVVPISLLTQVSPISVVPQGDIAALTAAYDQGFWVRDDNEGMDVEHDPDKDLGYLTKNQQVSIGYDNFVQELKYTKALYDWSNSLAQPFGLPLEVVPLKNPFNVKTGEKLPIEVLFQGQVVNNADVEYLDDPQNVNQNDITYIPIGADGLQPIEVDYSTDATANTPQIYYATSFTAQRSVPEPTSVLSLLVAGSLILVARPKLAA